MRGWSKSANPFHRRHVLRPLAKGVPPRALSLDELADRETARGLVALMSLAKPEPPKRKAIVVKTPVRNPDGTVKCTFEETLWVEDDGIQPNPVVIVANAKAAALETRVRELEAEIKALQSRPMKRIVTKFPVYSDDERRELISVREEVEEVPA